MLGDRWGVSDDETLGRYPCDDFVPAPTLQAWRGVSVDAPPAAVWQWVGQIRLAPYSYDWIDNLGRRSPQQLVDLPEPVAGEPFTTAGGRRRGRILAVDPGRHLTASIMDAVLSYVLVPDGGNTTRLLLKVVMRTNPVIALGGCLGDLVMARRQLLNLKRLAEEGAVPGR
ncbi:SRPBCC family protein [Micromonospora sp. CMU55-4]|uniref:SRPBCC family protein n=1 Tax=Micromonospora sp. CMU55-4 TaxID=2717028 RepID=UPI00140B266F|nr:SRPBCC family protein [Micromonospora sp. CMU55-4]NHO79860.1 SRPBCC family protein [Micromonospora sp. CMU55-4]